MKRVLVYIGITLLSGMLFMAMSNLLDEPIETKSTLYSKIFKVENGYGYKIFHNNKILIKQEYIPLLQGKRSFTTANDAKRTSNKVIQQLLKKQSPFLTMADLQELHIPIIN